MLYSSRTSDAAAIERVNSAQKTTIEYNDKFHGPSALERIYPHVKFRPSEYHAGSAVQRCQNCRTQYHTDFMDYDGHGVAMFLTRWKDLGSGPESEMWNQFALQGVAHLRSL